MINRFNKSPFTSKEGLCSALKDFHWFYEKGTEVYFPRCFNVFNPDELNEFTENFRTTACISLLRWLLETFEEKGAFSLISDDGRVPMSCIQFATSRCKDFIDCCLHNDIDVEGDIKIWEHDWDVFLTQHYLLTHENAKFQMMDDAFGSLEAYVDRYVFFAEICSRMPELSYKNTSTFVPSRKSIKVMIKVHLLFRTFSYLVHGVCLRK